MTDYTYWQRSRSSFLAEQRLALSVKRPTTFLAITGITSDSEPQREYRPPLWTRHMLGVIEAERDQRRRRKRR